MAMNRRTKMHVQLASLLALVGALIGCGPNNLAMLLYPFQDDKIEAKCKLARKDREVTVVVAAKFELPELRAEVGPLDQELAEALSQHIRKSAGENKEKIKIVPPLRVQPHLAKLGDWDHASLIRIGEQLKADYVICLTAANVKLVMPNSFNVFYQGRAEVQVKVFDAKLPLLEAMILNETYNCEYPTSRPIETEGTSPAAFRARFVNKMAKDLGRWFVAYPKDSRFELE